MKMKTSIAQFVDNKYLALKVKVDFLRRPALRCSRWQTKHSRHICCEVNLVACKSVFGFCESGADGQSQMCR